MAIIWSPISKVINRKFEKGDNNSLEKKEVKFYATAKSIKQISERDIAKLISEETTLNAKEAELAIAQLGKVMLQALKNGYSVKMGEWASFSVSLSSEGKEKRSDVNAKCIKQVHVICRIGTSFKEDLQKVSFVSAAKFQDKSVSVSDDDSGNVVEDGLGS